MLGGNTHEYWQLRYVVVVPVSSRQDSNRIIAKHSIKPRKANSW